MPATLNRALLVSGVTAAAPGTSTSVTRPASRTRPARRHQRDPAEVIPHVKPETETPVPSGSAYAFLGDPGDPVWILPQSENPDLLFAGWAAHEVPAGVFQGDSVQSSLTAVSGPPDAVGVSAGAHHHTNWAFEGEGTYTLTFRASGTLADGTTVTSEAVDYHFTVG